MTDYTKLVEALRCKRDDCEGCDLAFFDNDEGWMCQYAAKDADAADAIEELQAQLLKLGEWYTELYDGDKKYQCSNCLTHWDVETRYCPFCGAKMEVQDDEGSI